MNNSMTTRISAVDKTSVTWRGKDLVNELLGFHDFTEVMYLLLVERFPEPWERRIFDAALITLMEHGLTPHAIVARLVADSNPTQIQVAMAAGLNCVGDVFAGTMEGCAYLLSEGLEETDRDHWCHRTVQQYRSEGKPLPGFGHPTHKPDDPRSAKLFQIALEAGAPGNAIDLIKGLSSAIDEAYGRHLTINATGALAAILLEIKIPPRIMRGLAVTSRAAGLVAHIDEEQKTKSGRAIWRLVEDAFAHNE